MFSERLAELSFLLDGVILIPPQPHAANNPLPASEVWRALFQTSFIGPLATLKAAIAQMRPNVSEGQRAKIVIVSGIPPFPFPFLATVPQYYPYRLGGQGEDAGVCTW